MQLEMALPNSRASIRAAINLKSLGHNRWVLAGFALVLIGAGLVWQWSWLVAIGVAPLLVGAVPCVAMCALGLCMHRMCSRTGSAAPNGTSQALHLSRRPDMTIGKISFAVVAAALGALIVPAVAQNGSSDMQRRQDHGMSMGAMGQGMRGGGMMSGGMMAGCADMMQSMNNNGGNGRPNSQWQKHSPRNPDNGG